jgi:hypothetical protein
LYILFVSGNARKENHFFKYGCQCKQFKLHFLAEEPNELKIWILFKNIDDLMDQVALFFV